MNNRFSLVDKFLSISLVTSFEFDLVCVRCTEDIQTVSTGNCFHFRANKGLATVKMELLRMLAVSQNELSVLVFTHALSSRRILVDELIYFHLNHVPLLVLIPSETRPDI
jgi:hypothetical protein